MTWCSGVERALGFGLSQIFSLLVNCRSVIHHALDPEAPQSVLFHLEHVDVFRFFLLDLIILMQQVHF